MDLRVQSNLSMMSTSHQLKVNIGKQKKVTEKLSSGYRINVAADDSVGLTMSEEMRRMIRGLNQGACNARDGSSWVQTGDGALNEVHDIIHRMEELTVKALNGTNTEADRAYMQKEFDSLQSELDHLTSTTKFNEKHIFSEHEEPYYQFEGNVKWLQEQPHVITDGSNDLVIEYRIAEGDPVKTATITVPPGMYTTQELIDEIDSAWEAAGLDKEGLAMEFTGEGTCNMNLEGGVSIDKITGGLSYLIYDTYGGGSLGALIGTTVFQTEYDRLEISKGNNDTLTFTIESTDGSSVTKTVTIAPGFYTQGELVDLLNQNLQDTTVRAEKSGTGIKLASEDSIITGFKGNMFKIDESGPIYTSVFYDNVKYGTITMGEGYFIGGMIIPTDARDDEHRNFQITKDNQTLTLAPNGGSEVELTIPEGSYSISQMVARLNDLFKAEGLELTASIHPTDGKSAFQGIRITSGVKGLESTVGIDPGKSSAFKTLFVEHPYTEYKADAEVAYDTRGDKTASCTGGKTFSGDALPLEIKAGVNDRFTLELKDANGTASYTITLDPGTYTSAGAIRDQIDKKLNGANAPAGYRDRIRVGTISDQIQLTDAGNSLTDIRVQGINGNQGYQDIFVGVSSSPQVETSSTTSSKPQVTLNTSTSDPVHLDSSNNVFEVEIDGTRHTVTLPTGDVSHKDIVDAINDQLKPADTMEPNSFSDVNATGSTTDRNFNRTDQGNTTLNNHYTYINQGTSEGGQQGTAGGITKNNPAKVTLTGGALPANMTIDSSNNYFQCWLNDQNVNFTIPERSYTRAELVSELQQQLNKACGTASGDMYGGVKVTLENNQLVLTAGVKMSDGGVMRGEATKIECSPASSSFLQDIHATKTPASITSSQPLQNNIAINGSNNVFSFTLTEGSRVIPVELNLTGGSYNRYTLANEINRQLAAQGYGVTASVDYYGRLKLTTDKTGNGNGLSYSTQNGGSATEALFGEMIREEPAKETIPADIQEPVTITDSTNQLTLTVNNSPQTVTLDNGTYNTRQELVDHINSKLSPLGVKASLDGNRIHLETDKKGKDASFSISHTGGGSAIEAIFGEKEVHHNGATASFNSNGQLVITGNGNGGTISVSSDTGGAFQKPASIGPVFEKGYHSEIKAYIDGVDIAAPVKIDEWNKDLNFCYYDNGVRTNISLTLAEKDYTFDELREALQAAIDGKAGAGKMTVSVSEKGVRIEADKPGSKCYMPRQDFSGGFYYKVLCSSGEKTKVGAPEDHQGSQSNDSAYTVGRRDVKNELTKIQTGVNDQLKLDFTCGGKTYPISMTLDAGTYSGDELKEQIQVRLNEQLKKLGFAENMIEVGVGGINTGVTGANDDNALNFRLSSNIPLPQEGDYLIDGVSGTAAFSVFYQTEGDIARAYVKGSKDISEGVTIREGETEFSMDVDGTTYTFDIPAGTYSPEEIREKLNGMLKDAGAPVSAEIENGNLKFVSMKYGEHKITNITGSAKSDLFFAENGDTTEREKIPVQLSSEKSDFIVIDRPVLNTVSLRINSIAITQPKYAAKASERLKQALAKVSEIRTYFGSTQNRLEHAINNNDGASENTTAAESRTRDTDMSREAMKNATQSVLLKAAPALMADGNERIKSILQLYK